VDVDWQKFVQERRDAELTDIIETEKLKPDETRRFIKNAFRDGAIKTIGTDIDRILPPASRFGSGGGSGRAEKKKGVIERLMAFFEKFFGAAK
jgi:type I restriction enzyme R subunit